MSIRKERLQLIRERHRTLILAPRERIQMEAFAEEWDDSLDFYDDEVMTKKLSLGGDDEE